MLLKLFFKFLCLVRSTMDLDDEGILWEVKQTGGFLMGWVFISISSNSFDRKRQKIAQLRTIKMMSTSETLNGSTQKDARSVASWCVYCRPAAVRWCQFFMTLNWALEIDYRSFSPFYAGWVLSQLNSSATEYRVGVDSFVLHIYN